MSDEMDEQKQGRPTAYNSELGETICERLAEGMTLKAICRMDDIAVAESTVRSWAVNPDHPFSALYTRAREVGYHMMADELLDIADATETEPGHVARDRLRCETRKWMLSKALPKVYGDKLAIGGDPDTAPIKHIIEHVYVRPPGS